ncbi:MAG: hypothetical protein PHE80_05925 [Candidatus Omnitrophica bacterium]|nr:hypothetical protein [Candidatus Omnitrophota bacterium]MDD5738116.1 hypothetical protein [Candidatus Omnitrophota bacterium]
MKKLLLCLLAFSVVSSAHAQVMKKTSSSRSMKPAKKVIVYEEGKGVFAPSGWMGDVGCIKADPNCRVKPKTGKFCSKWTYDNSKGASQGWAGVYWLYPENNWGGKKGMDLSGHKRLSFWIRGETGKEVVSIKMGGVKGDFPDTVTKELNELKLGSQWKQYSIDLTGRDLSNISGGFCWTADGKLNPKGCTFYLDEVVYE